jgi:hypothetical protein
MVDRRGFSGTTVTASPLEQALLSRLRHRDSGLRARSRVKAGWNQEGPPNGLWLAKSGSGGRQLLARKSLEQEAYRMGCAPPLQTSAT